MPRGDRPHSGGQGIQCGLVVGTGDHLQDGRLDRRNLGNGQPGPFLAREASPFCRAHIGVKAPAEGVDQVLDRTSGA